MPNSKTSLPTISAITPSFNQAEYLGRCLESVSMQTHAALEHLVFDPGSTDDSRIIAEQHAGVTLIAEPDDGQADAVGKGFLRAKGDILAWLNSDDEYASPDVFQAVAERFAEPDAPDFVYGLADYVDGEGAFLRPVTVHRKPAELAWRLETSVGLSQPAVFIRKSAVQAIGVPDKTLNFAMDYEYWLRASQAGLKFAFLDKKLALSRYYPDNKTAGQRDKSLLEVCDLLKKRLGYVAEQWLMRLAEQQVEGFDGILQSGPEKAADADAVMQRYRDLLIAYNGDADALALLRADRDLRPRLDTWWAMIDQGVASGQPFKEAPPPMKQMKSHRLYTVGPRRWAFENRFFTEQTGRTAAMLERESQPGRKDVCVIVGNGPSLNDTDLDLLSEASAVFCANYSYLNADLSRHMTHLSVVNYLVAEQGSHDFNQYEGAMLCVPYWLRYCIAERDNVYFFKSVGKKEFSLDATENISWRSTVSFFQMQLAYHLGYRKVLLIGFDHNYPHQPDLKEGEIIDQKSDDMDHFDPAYFRGKRWQAADVGLMEEMYRLAREAFDADGRAILNCTVGGRLETFERSSLEAEFQMSETA